MIHRYDNKFLNYQSDRREVNPCPSIVPPVEIKEFIQCKLTMGLKMDFLALNNNLHKRYEN